MCWADAEGDGATVDEVGRLRVAAGCGRGGGAGIGAALGVVDGTGGTTIARSALPGGLTSAGVGELSSETRAAAGAAVDRASIVAAGPGVLARKATNVAIAAMTTRMAAPDPPSRRGRPLRPRSAVFALV